MVLCDGLKGRGRRLKKEGIDVHLWLIHVDFRNLSVQETKVIASIPIISWQIDGERMETMRDFILRGLQNHCR